MTDVETTKDLSDECTTDLTPVTVDITPTAEASPVDTGDTALAAEPSPAQTADAAPPPEDSAAHEVPMAAPASAKARPDVASAGSALAIGAVLRDRYLLERVIGGGGTAVVYQARDMTSSTGPARNARVAIKAPHSQADQLRAATRLRHEFEHARRLSHPSIVRVLELHIDAQPYFMTMELIEGRLLSSILRDWTMLPPPLAYKILRGCARALAYAHGHDIVHGDFKPANVFVTPDEQIKVVDFGAAAADFGDGGSRIPAGTPAYASPEVLSGATPDRRDDVFSFACVAYEALTGQHPFEHQSSLDAREQGRIPPRAWSLSTAQWLALLAALSWDREQRPSNVETLLNDLTAEAQHSSDNAPIHAAPGMLTTDLPQELMPPRRGWGFFIFIACTLFVTFVATQRQSETPQNEPVTVTAAEVGTALAPPSTNVAMGSGPQTGDIGESVLSAPPSAQSAAAEPIASTATPVSTAPARRGASGAGLSRISFESRSIVTSESSVAAVFLLKRSQPLSGRVRVRWNAISGSADAGIDFASDASGFVDFADGQAQRAIYVPLRNDLLQEEDETFTVRLHSAQNARLGEISRAEATIRDDD